MKYLPREWIVGGAAALLAVVLFLTSGPGEAGTVSVTARGTYDAAPVPEPRWIGQDIASVWTEGKDPMAPATEWSDLPAEDLGLPDFPANPLPSLPFRPAADARAMLKPVKAAVTDLPDDAALTGLRAAGKASSTPVPPEDEPLFDSVTTSAGVKIGKILKIDAAGTIQLQLKGGNATVTYHKGDYVEYHYAQTPAQEYQSRAVAIKSGSVSEHEKLAEWCMGKRLYEEAAKEFEESARLSLKTATLARLNEVYTLLSDPDREVRMYRELLEKRPTGAESVWDRLGRVYEVLGLPTRAMDAYLNALKVSPFYADAKQRLVTILAMEGRLGEAEQQLAGLSSDAKAKDLPETHLAAGTLAYFAGRFENAATELALAGPAGSHLLGCAQLSLGDGKAAAGSFKAALEANPDNIDAWIDLGVVCASAGDAPRAQACFEEASFRAPISPYPWAAIGWSQLKQGKAVEAGNAWDEALKRDARCAFALLGKGKIALDGGDPKTAEEKLISALKAGAGSRAFRELGLARLRLKNTSGAVEALRRAADGSTDPDAHALLGFALLPTNFSAAEAEFRLATEADSAHVLAACGLAAVVYARHELADARGRFDAVLSRVPDNAFAQRGKRLANEASTRRWWHDEFERKDGDAVRRTWLEKEKEGLRVLLAGGHAQFAGKQNRDDGVTALLRPTSDRFLSFEADLDFAKVGRATAGITVSIPQTGQANNGIVLRFARNAKGQLTVAQGALTPPPQPKEIGPCPAGVVRLRIERAPGNASDYLLFANGTQVGTPVRCELRSQKLEVGVFGHAFKDEAWELGIDNVRLIEAK
ncbi:MAG: tetratricopeptide repeat protein [Planctomycetes bacterium]|nr:tetratricopeptide repeat protein [Planctomycetota bacterium]